MSDDIFIKSLKNEFNLRLLCNDTENHVNCLQHFAEMLDYLDQTSVKLLT